MEKLRLNKLRHSLEQQGIEAMLITSAVNRRYLTGFTGTAGAVFITADEAVLLTDFRYMSQAPAQAPYYTVIEHEADIKKSINDLAQKWNIKRLAFEQRDMSYGTYAAYREELATLELVPTDGLVEHIRMVKDEGEIEVLREAAKLADDTFTYILDHLKPGVSEQQINFELEFYMRQHGATSSSFDTIVASGERSALPHGVASERIIQNNEFVKLDFGALYKGYCSDITRTVMIGTPEQKHRDIYDIVLEAQMHALDHIKPGMTGREADALTRDIIKRYGYGDHFGHSTGHGIGMDIHEEPRLSPSSDTILVPGMTVTIEPGIYIPGFGGVRIEDDIVMTENGAERLTLATKQFICL